MGPTFRKLFPVVSMVIVLARSSFAGEIVSDNFSIAFGANSSEGRTIWTVQENEGANVFPGDKFNLDVQVDGVAMSQTGPTFKERVLGAVSGSAMSGTVEKFLATITGKYKGPAPADAANPPNYRIQVNITSISIYGSAIGDEAGSIPVFKWHFNEVTFDHEQSQEEQPLEIKPGRFTNALNYDQLTWTPKNYASPAGDLDQEQGRLFDITESERNAIAIDGFEVSGNIVLTYDSKP